MNRSKFAKAVLKAKKIDKEVKLSDWRGLGRKNRVWIIAHALENFTNSSSTQAKCSKVDEAAGKGGLVLEGEIDIDSLWDDFSEYIGEDIDSLNMIAGKSVITRQQFTNLCQKLESELKHKL